MDIVLVYKLLAVPVVILLTLLIAKKWGPFVGGIFAGLPTFSGPISFFITYEQGVDFGIVSAFNSMIGLIGCVVTALVYSWLAYFGAKWWLALPCSVLGYFGTGCFLHYLPQFSPLVIVSALSTSLIAIVCLPRPVVKKFNFRRPPWILAVQILFGMFMVITVTETAKIIGPQWSGNMSCFPTMLLLLTPFAHIVNGVYAAVIVLRGLSAGWIGTACFSCIVILLVKHYHIAVVYTLAALSACLCTTLYSLAVLWVQKKYCARYECQSV